MTIGTNFSLVDDNDVIVFERLASSRNYSLIDNTASSSSVVTGDEFMRGFASGSSFGTIGAGADDEYQNGFHDGIISAVLTRISVQLVATPVVSVGGLMLVEDDYQSGYDEGVRSAELLIAAQRPSSSAPTVIASEVRVTLDDDDYQSGYDDGTSSSFLANALLPVVIPPPPPPIVLVPSTSRRSLPRGIMAVTPRFKWPVPTQNIDNWYDPFVSLQIAVDTSTFANTEDRNAICMGGGTFAYTQSSGLLEWDDTIEILSANTGFVRSIVSDSIALNEGELFLVELTRYPIENSIVLPLKASNLATLANINDTFVLAIRRNNIIYFRNGKNMQDGDSFKVFATVGSGGGGSVFTSLPVIGSGTIGSPITIGANAIANAKLALMNANTLKGNNTGISATPADLTASQIKAMLAIAAGDVSGLAAVATTGSASSLSGLSTVATTGNASDLSGLAAIATSGSAANLVAGAVPALRMPALTGDVTTSVGTVTTTIGGNKVANSMLAQMPALTIKGNNTVGTANSLDLTVSDIQTMLGFVTTASPFYFGDASDGSAIMDGVTVIAGMTPVANVYTAVRSLYFLNLTINSGVQFQPAGFRINVRGTITTNGTYGADGNAGVGAVPGQITWGNAELPFGVQGGAGTVSGTAGTASGNSPRLFDITTAPGGAAVGANLPGLPGTAGGIGHGGGGGSGGSGSSGGAGGGVSTATIYNGDVRTYENAVIARQVITETSTIFGVGSAGGGGSNGGFSGGQGGSGGSSAGWYVLHAFHFASGSGVYRARGGAGGPGAAGTGAQGGGGGGGGGAGAVFVIVTADAIDPAVDVAGGLGGAGSSGGTGGAGAAGAAGGSGLVLVFR